MKRDINDYIAGMTDDDLYKFTMQQAVIHKFDKAKAVFKFINRGKTKFPVGFGEALQDLVKQMPTLKLTKREEEFLRKKPFFRESYIQFLKGYRYDPREVIITTTRVANYELIDMQTSKEGYWFRTILWEVKLMAIVSQLFFEMSYGKHFPEDIERTKLDNAVLTERNITKAIVMRDLGANYADFGTRRRESLANQIKVVRDMLSVKGNTLIGTSNVWIAMLFDITPIGTHAHEWFMFHAAKYGYRMANKLALDNWMDVYQGDLGIALTDTFTTEAFFCRSGFDKLHAKAFDGVRHDSGDAVEFGEKVITYYESLGIDPTTKTIVFSDGLNLKEVTRIHGHFEGRIKISYGIGTFLSNDVGFKALNMVIKIILAMPEEYDIFIPCIKLSDNVGKHTGEPVEIEHAKYDLRIAS